MSISSTCNGVYCFTEPSPVLNPPIGVKATTLSSSSIILTWTDSTLGRNQRVTDGREYTVSYAPTSGAHRAREKKSAAPNMLIDDLRPNTKYEFSVRVAKAGIESVWSMTAENTTFEESKLVTRERVTSC